MSPLPERMELCQYNQRGHCKFGDKCIQKHENEICHDRNECTNQYCNKRHPRECRYFIQFGRCKFGGGCSYSHENDNKSEKEEKLEKEVEEMKEGMKKVENLEKEVHKLKAEVMNIKVNMARMYKLIKENQVIPEVKKGEDKKEVKDAESKKDDDKNDYGKNEDKDDNNSEIIKRKQGQTKFRCEQCDYEAKKKVTLMKHMNTKHGKVKSDEEQMTAVNEETKAKKGNTCQDCENCENCDYLDNNDCKMCDKLFEADIQEYKTRA